MGILKYSMGTLQAVMSCDICGKQISPEAASFGPYNAEGNVTTICDGHIRDGLRFIGMLADFTSKERQKYYAHNGNNLMQFRGVDADAGFIY